MYMQPQHSPECPKRHLARLRLKGTHIVRDGFVLFNMLFSDTTESFPATEMLHWRHLQLGIPRYQPLLFSLFSFAAGFAD